MYVLVHFGYLAATLWCMARRTARAIAADLERRLAAGGLSPGDRLPAVRTLADELGVSPATVGAAYQDLRRRGLVMGRGRQGTIVAPVRDARPSSAAHVAAGLVDAMHGSPDPRFLPPLTEALAFAAAQPQPGYGGPMVAPALAEVATELFRADAIDASHLCVTSGAMDAVERVLAAFDLRPGDRIGVEDPGHIPVHQIARSSGYELVPLAVDECGVQPAGLEAALAGGLSALVVTPRAQNPTGAAFDAVRAEELSDLLAGHPETGVIQDDHAGLISAVDHCGLDVPARRWATMRSLGKSLGPDMRVALVVGDERTMARVTTALGNGPGWVSFLLQRATAFLLRDAATRMLLDEAAASYARRRNRLIDALQSHGVAGSGASGLNVWVPTSAAQASIDAARDAGFAIRSGQPYQLSADPAVRITISNLDDTGIDDLAAAIGRAHHRSPAAAPM